jgi:putative chitinase
MFTKTQLQTIYPRAKAGLIDGLIANAAAWEAAGILAKASRGQFLLAQMGHESGGMTIVEENLNYSASRLMAVWPSRFPTLASAQPYAGNPQKLANKVYGGRMGNTGANDGWTYRGRGFIQITGKDGYANVGALARLDLVGKPELAADPAHAGAVVAAFASWKKLNEPADAGDFVTHTKRINGGTIGIDDRKAWLNKVLAAVPFPFGAPVAATLSDARIKAAQTKLKALGLYAGSIDGIIGKLGRAALRAFQAGEGLPLTEALDAPTLKALNV